MKKSIFTFLTLCVFSLVAQAQAPTNDECSGAIQLTSAATCTVISGNYENATQSLSACTGSTANDVWYSFIANSTSHKIQVQSSIGDIVLELFSGSCSNLTSMYCADMYYQSEIIESNRFVVGETYYFRIYEGTGINTNSGTFDICLTTQTAITAPNNDDCIGATMLTPNIVCTSVQGTIAGATQSMPENDCETYDAYATDVWYSFVATAATADILVKGSSAFDAIVEAFSGSCNNLVSIDCVDNTYPNSNNIADVTETLSLTNLVVGETYYIRVYEIAAAYLGMTDFSICIVSQTAANPCDTTNLVLTLDGCDANHEVTTVTGGVAPYTYAWSTADATAAITGLVIGETYTVTVTDANACQATQTFVQDICNSIAQVASGFNMNIYPNPAKSAAVLSLQTTNTSNLSIELVNVMGQVISSQIVVNNGTMTYALPIENLSAGVYFVKVSSKEGIATKQLIIAK